jgi:hypothetical protein
MSGRPNQWDDVALPAIKLAQVPLGDLRLPAKRARHENMDRHNEANRPHSDVNMSVADIELRGVFDERREIPMHLQAPTPAPHGRNGKLGALAGAVNRRKSVSARLRPADSGAATNGGTFSVVEVAA